MEPFIERLRQLLRSEFPGSQDELEPRPARKVGGFLIWEGFSGLEQIERQRRVWGVLRERLKEEDQHRITAILTATPAEWSAMTENVGTNVKVRAEVNSESFQATGEKHA